MKNAKIVIDEIYSTIQRNNVNIDFLENTLGEKELYKHINNNKLIFLLSYIHNQTNRLIKVLFDRKGNHFKAADSRALIEFIDYIASLNYGLQGTEYSFQLIDSYKELLDKCKDFLCKSGGSEVPYDIPVFPVILNEPIFIFQNSVELDCLQQVYADRKLIGEGSYAYAYKYLDPNYGINFVIKKARKDLRDDELKRFINEYKVLENLKSPYIVNVYKYNEKDNEYSMEYADSNLEELLRNKPNLDKNIRKQIVYQILKAFSYIHSKNIFHRDISPRNVLIFFYEDVRYVAKLCDFGLVKLPESTMTSLNTEIKGTFNDWDNLDKVGFNNYGIFHETYALTKLVYFTMTGRKSYKQNGYSEEVNNFYMKGTNAELSKRFRDVDELKQEFSKIKW